MIPTNILLCSLISLVFSVAIPQEDTNELLQDLDRRDPAVACSWPRHCLGAPCLTSDDCSDILVCTQFFCSEPSLVTSVSVVTSRAITITSTVATRPSSPSVTPSDPSSSDKAPSPEPTSNYNVIFGPMNTNEITHFDGL